MPQQRVIGLIGWMSWKSSAEYYRLINEGVRERLGGAHSARVLMWSFDFGEIKAPQHAGRWDEATGLMIDAARQLERGGADFLLICANTMHRMADEVASAVRIPLLHIVDPAVDAIRAGGGHYEIYLFGQGTGIHGDMAGQGGVDFNYGAAEDLQLTATLPAAFDSPSLGASAMGLGNIDLRAKWRLLHRSDFGLDVAPFPHVLLPASSARFGTRQVSVFLPVWLQRDWDKWSVSGGGGCVVTSGGALRDSCIAGGVLTRQVLPDLQLGVELVHQTPNSIGGRPTTGLGFGATYDLSDVVHLLAYAGPGLQNAAQTNQVSWYASFLFTF